MKTNRLSDKLTALNEQMTKEAHASQIYLSYGAWADNNGFSGIANFLFRHAAEERNHMMKMLEYILNRGKSHSYCYSCTYNRSSHCK
jgi:ferritin